MERLKIVKRFQGGSIIENCLLTGKLPNYLSEILIRAKQRLGGITRA